MKAMQTVAVAAVRDGPVNDLERIIGILRDLSGLQGSFSLSAWADHAAAFKNLQYLFRCKVRLCIAGF